MAVGIYQFSPRPLVRSELMMGDERAWQEIGVLDNSRVVQWG